MSEYRKLYFKLTAFYLPITFLLFKYFSNFPKSLRELTQPLTIETWAANHPLGYG